ncbi:class E sortase [Bifidobacterium kimbladii]|uniref:Sortase family protein n=1 Tax=Bifidobacterium asteroides TaxID=1684 RepID=A0A0F4L607_9BIFI|nr:class E sortase [Bifidobacterium asteroides]KJY53001.1 Sortase family protein [Bifidobacterium asteroides]
MTTEDSENDRTSVDKPADKPADKRRTWLVGIAEIVGELLITLAVICALYVVWQLWWTGVQSEHQQLQARASTSWSNPGSGDSRKVAKPQKGAPPVQPKQAAEGELMAQAYIPRFGQHWERNVVQGTSPRELAYAGLGHYPNTQMPGEMGNVAIAGHRAGYGEPLGHVDELRVGDAIVLRTKDYWYVYHYTRYKIVSPEEVSVIAPNPYSPNDAPDRRMITLTTCEPKYTTATHRWISWGEFGYWAKVSDGVPKELLGDRGSNVAFADDKGSVMARLGSLQPVFLVLAAAYLIIYLAALAAWRYPLLKQIRKGEKPQPMISLYGWLLRHQSGIAPIRWLLLILLLLALVCALMEWGFPWLASNVPMLRQMSNYSTF